MTRTMMSVAVGCSVLALTACGGGGGETASTTTTATTPSATAPATTTTTTASTSAAPAAGALPAVCETYIQRLQQCTDRLGANSNMGATVRQQMGTVRAQWSQIPDQTALANACTQMDAQWAQTSSAMGC